MPRSDLVGPTDDRAPELVDLNGHLGAVKVAAALGSPVDGEVGVGAIVDLKDGLLRSTANHTSRCESPAHAADRSAGRVAPRRVVRGRS